MQLSNGVVETISKDLIAGNVIKFSIGEIKDRVKIKN